MPRHDKATGELVYQTDSKKFEAAPAYLMTVFNQIDKIGNTITNNEDGYANPNFDIHTQYILALIIDPEKRELLKKYRKERVAKEVNKDMSSQDKNIKMFEINMDTIGEAITAFDDFLGVVTKQEILRVKSPRVKQYEKEYLEQRGLE